MISLLQLIRPLGSRPWPRWRYARPGPLKSPGVKRRFQHQASGTPVDCQAIFDSPTRRHPGPVSAFFADRANLHSAAIAFDG